MLTNRFLLTIRYQTRGHGQEKESPRWGCVGTRTLTLNLPDMPQWSQEQRQEIAARIESAVTLALSPAQAS